MQRCFSTAIVEAIKRCSRHIPVNIKRGKSNLPKGLKAVTSCYKDLWISFLCVSRFCILTFFICNKSHSPFIKNTLVSGSFLGTFCVLHLCHVHCFCCGCLGDPSCAGKKLSRRGLLTQRKLVLGMKQPQAPQCYVSCFYITVFIPYKRFKI